MDFLKQHYMAFKSDKENKSSKLYLIIII